MTDAPGMRFMPIIFAAFTFISTGLGGMAAFRFRDRVCGELLLVARLNNSPTHEKRPKAYAEPKAAGLSVGGRSKSPRSAERRPRAGHARASAG